LHPFSLTGPEQINFTNYLKNFVEKYELDLTNLTETWSMKVARYVDDPITVMEQLAERFSTLQVLSRHLDKCGIKIYGSEYNQKCRELTKYLLKQMLERDYDLNKS